MDILYIHQYFLTPSQAGGTRSYWVSLELIKRGHQVTVLTSARQGQKERVLKRNIDGIEVIYLKNQYSNKMSIKRRILSFVKYMISSSIYALELGRYDFVYATSTPLTIGFPALLLKRFKRIPYFFEVRDLWPEFPIQMGAIRYKLVRWGLRSFELSIYKQAIHIIALSPGMKEGVVERSVDPQKVSVVPNMSKIDKFFPHDRNEEIMRKYNISPSKFKVIHFGAMGLANGLEYIIHAADKLKSKGVDDIEFIFLGDGMVKDDIIAEIKIMKLEDYFIFIERQPMVMTSEIVNCSDCSIVTFRNIPVLRTNSPNKLFDSLSAGKPVIVNSAGWTKELVENSQIGFFVDPEKPEELADRIVELKENQSMYDQMCNNSRKLAIEKYDKSILCKTLIDIISEKMSENLEKNQN